MGIMVYSLLWVVQDSIINRRVWGSGGFKGSLEVSARVQF